MKHLGRLKSISWKHIKECILHMYEYHASIICVDMVNEVILVNEARYVFFWKITGKGAYSIIEG
jgi:hypothetical protein